MHRVEELSLYALGDQLNSPNMALKCRRQFGHLSRAGVCSVPRAGDWGRSHTQGQGRVGGCDLVVCSVPPCHHVVPLAVRVLPRGVWCAALDQPSSSGIVGVEMAAEIAANHPRKPAP